VLVYLVLNAHNTITNCVCFNNTMYLKRNIEASSCNHCCSGKTMMITQPECVCSLRYPPCKAHAPFCRLCPVRLYNVFLLYLIKCKIFEKKIIEHKMCVLIFSINLPETFLTLRRDARDMIKTSYWFSRYSS